MDADVIVKTIENGQEVPAVSKPHVIIKVPDPDGQTDRDTYLVPLALWGYRLADAVDQDEIDGCNAVINSFNQSLDSGSYVAVIEIPGLMEVHGRQTNPPRKKGNNVG